MLPSLSPTANPAPAERFRLRLLTASALGAASVAAFAPLAWFPLLWLTLAGLFLLLRGATSPRQAFLLGWAFAGGLFLVGVSWVYVSLSVFGGMPVWLAGPATVLFCAVLALIPGGVAWLFRRWLPASVWAQILSFAALWGLGEWLRGWFGTGFPWLAAGYAQTPPSPLAGYAPLLGVYGLSLLTAGLAGLLAVAAADRRSGYALAAAMLLAVGWGLRLPAWTEPAGEPISVALVQGNVPQDLKFLPENFIRSLRLYRDLVAAHPAQLTVLPETAVPAFLEQLPAEYVDEMKALARRHGGDLIFGAATGAGERYWNSAVSIGASPLQVYSKTHLVPFGEFIPPGFAWFMAMARIPMSEFSRGPAMQPPLAVAGRQVATNICYEDAFGEEIIRALPAAGILVNLSNTAWFGDSLAQPQHLQIARLRALETGRPMLRATNTGMTAVVAPDGTISAVLPPFTTGVLTADVRAYSGLTPYARWGNWAFLLLAGCLLLVAVRRRS